MLNNEVKKIINEVVNLYSSNSLSQIVIDEGKEKLTRAIKILKDNSNTSSDVVSYSLRKDNNCNINKMSTFYDDNGNNPITVNNMTFTEGNVDGYSGWTKRGLQTSSKNTIAMDYIPSRTIEININTLNWQLRRGVFVISVLLEDGSEYIVKALCWGSTVMYMYPINDEVNSVDSNSFSRVDIEEGVDGYHSFVMAFNEDGYETYFDGVLGNKTSRTVLKNVKGIKLYTSGTLYSGMPYESVKFYKDILTSEQIASNYQSFINRINATGYENTPYSDKTNFNTVSEMIVEHLKEGSVVTTNGYRNVEDNGGATYKIMTYETFYNELPEDCRKVQINGEVKTIVDEYGNHTLKNGLVAKIISEDNTFTPEQWGAVGDGVTSDTEAFICMLALTKTGTINFKDGAVYIISSRTENDCSQYTDCRYLKSMMGKFSGGCHRPLIANCKNLSLNGNPSGDGNKATMKIPDNDFGFGMGMLCLGAVIEGLEIKNIIFDSNGLTMCYGSAKKGVNNKTSNHTIVYDFGGNYEKSILNDLNIHHCKFLSNGTIVDIADGGGDHILIINPCTSNRVWIEDNEFYDWGRWVYSVDLGGNGERFYDYKFNRNICIQTDDNYIPRINNKCYRGLGWIDFEARKCFTDLEVCGNTVEGLVGFAMNGNGRVLENFVFNDNNITFKQRTYRSAYPYFLNFYSISCAKNSILDNNYINCPYSILISNNAIDGLKYTNNTHINCALMLKGVYGDVFIDNNKREGTGALIIMSATILPDYAAAENVTNFTFTNNEGGIIGVNGLSALLFDPRNHEKYKNVNVKIEGNKMLEINLSSLGNKPFDFDTTQLVKQPQYGFAVRGAKFIKPTFYSGVNMPVMGCGIYEEGNLVVENIKMTRGELLPPFYKVFVSGKSYNVYCSKTGYLPQIYTDHYLTLGQKLNHSMFYFTDDNLYIAQNSGQTPTNGELPSHTSGVAKFGEVNLLWIAPIGRIRVEEII